MKDTMEIYYDHYKDSFQEVKAHLQKRDQYFILNALFLFASMFTAFNPAYVQEASNNIGKLKFGVDLNLAFYTINSIFVFLFLWFAMKYYQTVLIVENLYIYLHNVEDKLSSTIKDFEISREGKSYLDPYPILKSCIHYFYFIVYPLVVISLSIIKIYAEVVVRRSSIPTIALLFDVCCLIITVVLTLFYLSWIHFKDFTKKREGLKNAV